jgi:heptosyltransferase-1
LRKLRRLKGYDFVIDAQGLLKSAIVAKIISSNENIGFDKKSAREAIASIFYNHKVTIGYDENTIDRNISVMCKSLDIEVKNKEILNKDPFIYPSNKKKSKFDQCVIFVVGSTWESRNYPKDKFVEIANKLKKKCIVIWGNESEMIKAKWMERQSNFIDAAPKLELDDLKQVINRSVLVIGNDSGPSHFAWAMNIPSIILFGPTPVNRVYQTKINRVLKSSSKVDHFNLDKNDFSIKEIQVNDIVKIAKELI